MSYLPEPLSVTLIGLAGGVLLGLASRLGRFCTMGAIEDYLYAQNDTRLRMWGTAIGAAITGTFILAHNGFLDLGETYYYSVAWMPLASILGGLMFGYGMALAGNCGYGALARLGGGDMRAFVIVLVMGVSAYAVLLGPLAYLRVWAFPQAVPTSETAQGYAHLVGSYSGIQPTLIGMIVGLAFIGWMISSTDFRSQPKYIAWGFAVGAAIVSGWAGTQWVAETGFAAVPVVSHSFSAPVGESILYLMTASGRDLSFALGSVSGVLIGAFIGSLIKGHFRWEACEDPRELKRQILGAILMGAGAVIALGCTVGQGITAFSTLTYSAPVTFASIFIGAAFGLRQLITGFEPAE
ncbi:MAG: YeeE/YedE family protein [Paracoccaceae bacterium]|nr:YeeE/YedE family protein [Paracoccaceae bacterium]MDG2257153.1 YeeE/YedE family protein [Paracoccaceae bacterium]